MNELLFLAGAAGSAFLLGTGIALNLYLKPRRAPSVTAFSIAPVADTPADYGLGMESFECPEWRRSGGGCCPEGAIRLSCPGLRIRSSVIRAG